MLPKNIMVVVIFCAKGSYFVSSYTQKMFYKYSVVTFNREDDFYQNKFFLVH